MIELYNEDNIKVYVDSTGYSITPHGGGLLLTDKDGNGILRLPNRETQGFTITIKGNTITLEGILLDYTINNYGYNITLKGDVRAWVNHVNSGPNVYTHSLYGSSEIRTATTELTKHSYLLHDSANLQLFGTVIADTCDVVAYDNSTVMTQVGCTAIIYDTAQAITTTPDAKIYAYDNSTVFSYNDKNIHLFDNAKRSNY